ncbi:MAG: acetylxylan esterase, partial [Planctomycetes bacterium]|nr:acetylxylan esterase [Planctomycetota bacterium]
MRPGATRLDIGTWAFVDHWVSGHWPLTCNMRRATLIGLTAAISLASARAEEPTMLYRSLVRRAEEVSTRSLADLPSLDTWKAQLPEKRRRWLEMLGLDPLPERTEMHVTVTGVLDRGHYVVEKLHFQPLPGCRIAANLYRPKNPQGKLPAVIYLCGHAQRSKWHYQAHPRWFGEHGYIGLVLDAIQIGENTGFHHGTYSKQWWHWYSQGYSPAGVDVWAAMRAMDYLSTRPDVDPSGFGMTGNSGGGEITWFTAAADERVKVAVPSCQTGTMYQQVRDRTIDGHCDCAFWVNVYGWDYTDVAGLIAPRALLVAAATEDTLWRPYAYRDLVHRVRMLYRLYGCEDKVGLVEDVAPHGYTPKTRLALFNWFEKHLKGSDKLITEDFRTEQENDDDLAVYPTKKPPPDDRLKDADKFFIPLPGAPEVKDRPQWERHQRESLAKLRATTFRWMPDSFKVAHFSVRAMGLSGELQHHVFEFESEPGMPIRAELGAPVRAPKPFPLVVAPLMAEAKSPYSLGGTGMSGLPTSKVGMASVSVRGTGDSSIGPGLEWTVRRAYPILGYSLPERQTLDLLRAVALLREQPNVGETIVFGKGANAALAIYAALLDPSITEVILQDPVTTHWNAGPEFLGVLKVGDLPHNLTLLFPRRITFVGKLPEAYQWTK